MEHDKRLIDANALYKEVEQEYDLYYGEIVTNPRRFAEMVEDAPTVDAVEVVRCKKCLYSSQYADENGMYKCGGILTEDGDCFLMVKPDHFCAFGELRGKKMDGGK